MLSKKQIDPSIIQDMQMIMDTDVTWIAVPQNDNKFKECIYIYEGMCVCVCVCVHPFNQSCLFTQKLRITDRFFFLWSTWSGDVTHKVLRNYGISDDTLFR